ncbi:protein translocase subunit SecF [Geopsychrobacter electrodiphilus]|uniref:protein translocase subunit SecF n=1 Tax=Geopsychrobacter electrodiphilus TaxID=225196 RepID=UPI00036C8750|nr:protein translocase subunit SecF [Geopsychrobacter electrodiphilus]
MELIKSDTNIDFVGKRTIAMAFSLLLIAIGIISLIYHGGPDYGIDFAGGTLVQVRFAEATNATAIKKALAGMKLGGMVVQQFGDDKNEFMIRMENTSQELKAVGLQVQEHLDTTYGADKVEVRRTEMVGPQVGSDLRMKGLKAILYAMIGLLAYISWRFEFRFAVGAIVALVHDVAITIGAFSLTGREIDLPIIAAFLAIIGYSLNDTIIVYDRIRENVGRYNKESFSFIVNRSVNDTLSRTLLTSGTTLLAVLALFIWGGGVIHNFAFAMLVGILIGTYSSVFVASPILMFWEQRKLRKS